MLPIQILLVLTSCVIAGGAILEKVGEADLEAVRIRLEDEKAKRLLLENDVEVLMIKVEELKRGFSKISEDNIASQGNLASLTTIVAFTATLSNATAHVNRKTAVFDKVNLNEGNCYDSSTGRFHAPVRGLYIFSVTILKGSTRVHLMIMKDDVEIGKVFSGNASADSGSVTVLTVMEKGQAVYLINKSGETQTMLGNNWAHFTGLLHIQYN